MTPTLWDVGDELLRAAEGHLFGTEPGRVAPQLYEALARADDEREAARLAAALARVWAYGGHADRAIGPAAEAVRHAENVGDPALLADCLDALLAAQWGPDALDDRLRLAARLDEVAAQVLDPEVRLKAQMWMLQVATETLNIHELLRHLRALERLGEESPKARFFASSRRLMYNTMRGRFDTAPDLIRAAEDAATESGVADGWMVVAALRGYVALFTGDRATCAEVAQMAEDLAVSEGIAALHAEAATVWLGAGAPASAERLLRTFQGGRLRTLARDHDWLLTMQLVLDAALALGDDALVVEASELLAPYEGRAVVNAGAVMFHGVTDDTLSRAAARTGDAARAVRLRESARSTYIRIGATWWLDRLDTTVVPSLTEAFHLRPSPAAGEDVWLVGRQAAPIRALRGLTYVRRLVDSPGQSVAALDLVSDNAATVVQAPIEAIDAQAVSAYRARLLELDEEIVEASEGSDLGRLDRLQAERVALIDELSASVGLGGRRRTAGSSAERARVAVAKALNTALTKLDAVDGEMAAHLRTSIRTGHECVYDPRTPVEWVTT